MRRMPPLSLRAGRRHLLAAVWLALACAARGATFVEDFSTTPASRGWRVFGDASLFRWNPSSQSLEVTWDSSRPNSYFYRRLDTVLGKQDDFALQFDLRLSAVQAGANPAKPSTFQIAVGFLRLASATNAAFNRGTGRDSPHLVEWNYFPAADIIEATVSPVIVSGGSQFVPGFNFPLEMPVHDLFRITLRYTAANRTLVTTMTRNGAVFGPIQDVRLPPSFTDFRVDAVSIHSYNDAGDPFGSVFARGSVDQVVVTTPPPAVAGLGLEVRNGVCLIQFAGRAHWTYFLERSGDLATFATVQTATAAGDATVSFAEPWTAGNGFYRIRAERP